ncbi:LLM class flavin-dependent oxidoreductase [Paenibacillus thalictri]|uniref:LLM class flavin-dependent oxidoreductase n=1 Tax=Paenibacillus thalictri TaxID=2527873 RepID=A0A4Q9DJX0_9BACL|nr:LLM class flavin-dependent oxidoreductase [Paenibacillus thalictri]TBL70911.1 LLM class flavin-dependent oxidoreductase [Paenibacillus thalictri]
MSQKRQMKLGTRVFGIGHYRTLWRQQQVAPNGNIDFKAHVRQAQYAESAKFDFIFFSDRLFFDQYSAPKSMNQFEPLTIISALSAVTSKLGFVATASTSYTEPFNLARILMSADQISGGRVGWNAVTTALSGAALNFSRDKHFSHSERYQRAQEHLDIVRGLWDTWEDDAFVYDKENNKFFDPAKLHTLDYKGQFFNVRGPLNISRSEQGQPVIFQAGGSETGKTFAAQNAEGIYTIIDTLPEAQVFYADVKRRTVQAGRSEDDVLIFPGMYPFIGRTEKEAWDKYNEVVSYITYEEAVTELKLFFKDTDFSKLDPDAPFPEFSTESSEGYRSMADRIVRIAKGERLSLKETAFRFGSPKQEFVGTPERIADRMQAWFEQRGCDGFNVWAPYVGGQEEFAEKVLPILQDRGLFRKDYEADTLRGNLGLSLPENRYAGK